MRIVAFTLILLISTISSMAQFYPPTVSSKVNSIKGNNISLSNSFPKKGMSGVVIHNYGSELTAISSYLIYRGGKKARLHSFEPIIHGELPTVKSNVKVGDRVIAGYLYKTILLLAPDSSTYSRITSSASKNWVHPDLYAIFLSKEGDQVPTKDNLAKFASEYQIGLVYIVRRGKGMLYDPISRKYVGQTSLKGLPKKGQFPFYMRLGKIDSGWFSREATGTYYQSIGNIR